VTPLQATEILAKLQAQVGYGAQLVAAVGPGDAFIVVPAAKWRDSMQILRTSLGFDFLRALTGVDRLEQGKIEVVAHLFAYARRNAIVVKTQVDRKAPSLASVHDIWPAANWHEREIYDLLGVRFVGHPDLRRLLLPDDWEGYPLRKDYRQPASYLGIPMTRPGPDAAPAKVETP
jgi:NADH-quinone oxidoreductase subunit C